VAQIATPLGCAYERLRSGCRLCAAENGCQIPPHKMVVVPLRADAACTTFSNGGKTFASDKGHLCDISKAMNLNLYVLSLVTTHFSLERIEHAALAPCRWSAGMPESKTHFQSILSDSGSCKFNFSLYVH